MGKVSSTKGKKKYNSLLYLAMLIALFLMFGAFTILTIINENTIKENMSHEVIGGDIPSEINNAIVLALLIVLLSICIGILIAVYIAHKKQADELERALVEVKRAKREKEQQLEVLDSVADTYYSMHVLDLNEDKVVEYEAKNQVKDIVDLHKGGRASVIMKEVMQATMSDPYLEIGLQFADVSTLKKRLEGKKFIAMDLLGKNVGWIRMSFITLELDAYEMPSRVLCTTQIVDDEKKREEELIKESNTDELTGLFNRRAYEEDLQNYPSVPPEENFVYVAMDINGLKHINDTLGHDAGDELIKGAVSCMKQCIGNYGRLYRVGGDEFAAIIFADQLTLNDIKRDFDEVQAKYQGRLIDSISVSSGYVTKREFPDDTVAELAKTADKRMYEEKAKYYATKGIDRRGQVEANAALCAMYSKILKINLTEDSYKIVTMDMSEQSEEKGFSGNISTWLSAFGKSGQVHPEDLDYYLKHTDGDYLKDYFKSGKNVLYISYRRSINGEYRRVMMDIIHASDYSDDNQSLFLFVKQDIE